jgi:hypothetical protein
MFRIGSVRKKLRLFSLSLCGVAVALPVLAQSQPSSSRRSIQVYFPKMPESDRDFTYVEPVMRRSDRVDVAAFALEQLAEGPTQTEQQQGFTDPLDFRGESVCGDRDFTIDITDNLAQLQFCRTVVSGGVGDDARLESAVRSTLTQFSSIDSVVLLSKDGNCLGDLSGENACFDNIEQVLWQPVPATRGNPDSELNGSSEPWEVGLNTIARNGNAINFDVNANGKYVRYSANCQRQILARIRLGAVENNRIVEARSVNERYTAANRFQAEVLEYACDRESARVQDRRRSS